MKRIALLAVIGAGLLALPGTAAAQVSDCSGVVGTTTAGDTCVDAGGIGGEAVIRPSVGGCSYINGWTSNPVQGYAGLCLGAAHDAGCGSADEGSGANTGGCFWIKPLPPELDFVQQALQNPVADMFICGNTSGEDPQASGRDGCKIP